MTNSTGYSQPSCTHEQILNLWFVMRLILPVYTTTSHYKHFIYFPSVFIFPLFSTGMRKQLAFVTSVATAMFQTILLELWLQCSSFVCYFLFYDSFISQYILRLVRLFSYKLIKVIRVDWPKYVHHIAKCTHITLTRSCDTVILHEKVKILFNF